MICDLFVENITVLYITFVNNAMQYAIMTVDVTEVVTLVANISEIQIWTVGSRPHSALPLSDVYQLTPLLTLSST